MGDNLEHIESMMRYNTAMLTVLLKNQGLLIQYVEEVFNLLESQYNNSDSSKVKFTTETMNKLRRDLAELNYEEALNQVQQVYLKMKKETV